MALFYRQEWWKDDSYQTCRVVVYYQSPLQSNFSGFFLYKGNSVYHRMTYSIDKQKRKTILQKHLLLDIWSMSEKASDERGVEELRVWPGKWEIDSKSKAYALVRVMVHFNDKLVCNKKYTRDEAIQKLMEYHWVERDAIIKSLQKLRDTSTDYVSFTIDDTKNYIVMEGRKDEEEQPYWCTHIAFDEKQ